jgi:hypothetical protein
MFRSEKLTKAAQHADCQSCGKYKPSVPAHGNWHQYGKGAGLKAHDCYVAFVCPRCHDEIDGRVGDLTKEEQHEKWMAAWIKTILFLFQSGAVSVKGLK